VFRKHRTPQIQSTENPLKSLFKSKQLRTSKFSQNRPKQLKSCKTVNVSNTENIFNRDTAIYMVDFYLNESIMRQASKIPFEADRFVQIKTVENRKFKQCKTFNKIASSYFGI
jgi:hypothetical protein